MNPISRHCDREPLNYGIAAEAAGWKECRSIIAKSVAGAEIENYALKWRKRGWMKSIIARYRFQQREELGQAPLRSRYFTNANAPA